MRRTMAASLTLALAGLLASSPGLGTAQSGSAWPSFHGTGTRSGLGAGNGPTSNTVASQWQLPRGVYSSPVVDANGVGYVGDDDGNVYKLTPGTADPKMLYAAGTQAGIHSSPQLTLSNDGKTLYVGSPTGALTAVSTSNGSKVWSTSIPGGLGSAPLLSNDGSILYIPGNGGIIYELNAGSGAVSCQRPAGQGTIPGSLAISPDGSTVYAATYNGTLMVLPSGSQLCTASGTVLYTTGPATSSAAVDANGTVYVASGTSQGAVQAFSGGNTTPAWSYQVTLGTTVPSTPAIGAGLVVFGGSDGHVYALNSSGAIAWNQATGGPVESSPVIANGSKLIYVANDNGAVFAFDTSGNVVWSRSTGSPIVGSPALGPDGTLWVAAVSGYVYRFGNLPNPPGNPGNPTPRPTGTAAPTATPTTSTGVTKVPLSISVKSRVHDGKKQSVKITSAPNTVVHIRVNYPNGDHQSHPVTTNASGKGTYTYTQGASKVFHNRLYATVIAKAGTGAAQTTVQKQYKILFGNIDVTAEPRTQAVGKVVNIFIHTKTFTRVVAILKFPVGRSARLYGKTGKHGWAHIRYKVGKKLTKGKNRKVIIQAWLQSGKPAWHTSTWLTIK